jgi:hypothetical protein
MTYEVVLRRAPRLAPGLQHEAEGPLLAVCPPLHPSTSDQKKRVVVWHLPGSKQKNQHSYHAFVVT